MNRSRRLIDALLLQLSTASATLGVVIWAVTSKYGNLAKNYAPELFTWRWILTAVWAIALAALVLLPRADGTRKTPAEPGA